MDQKAAPEATGSCGAARAASGLKNAFVNKF